MFRSFAPSVKISGIDTGVKRLRDAATIHCPATEKSVLGSSQSGPKLLSIAEPSLSTLTKNQNHRRPLPQHYLCHLTRCHGTEFNLAVIPSAFDG